MAGPFERAYKRGVTEKVGPPPSRPRALPPAPFALHGAVITPEEAWSSGYVTVAAGSISAVSKRKPTDVHRLIAQPHPRKPALTPIGNVQIGR